MNSWTLSNKQTSLRMEKVFTRITQTLPVYLMMTREVFQYFCCLGWTASSDRSAAGFRAEFLHRFPFCLFFLTCWITQLPQSSGSWTAALTSCCEIASHSAEFLLPLWESEIAEQTQTMTLPPPCFTTIKSSSRRLIQNATMATAKISFDSARQHLYIVDIQSMRHWGWTGPVSDKEGLFSTVNQAKLLW